MRFADVLARSLYVVVSATTLLLLATSVPTWLTRGSSSMAGELFWLHTVGAGPFVVAIAVAALWWSRHAAELRRGHRLAVCLLLVGGLGTTATILIPMLKWVDVGGSVTLHAWHRAFAVLVMIAVAVHIATWVWRTRPASMTSSTATNSRTES